MALVVTRVANSRGTEPDIQSFSKVFAVTGDPCSFQFQSPETISLNSSFESRRPLKRPATNFPQILFSIQHDLGNCVVQFLVDVFVIWTPGLILGLKLKVCHLVTVVVIQLCVESFLVLHYFSWV
jgi:hypothetical protein